MRQRPGVLCAVLLFTLSGAPSSVHAQTISGTVIDDLGAAVPNARVSLRLPDGEVASETTAGADGVFVLEVPESGEYHVAADAAGHLPLHSRLLAIDATRSFDLDLELSRAAAETIEHEVPPERYEEWVRKFVRDWRTRQVVVVPGPEWRSAAAGRTLYEALEMLDLPGISYRDVGNGRLCPQSRSSTRCLPVSVLSHGATTRLRDIEADEVDGLVFLGPGVWSGPTPGGAMSWSERRVPAQIILFLEGYLLPYGP